MQGINFNSKEINDLGYEFYMNNKYHTIMILPNREFSKKVQDCFVGFNQDEQFIQYTLDDKNMDINKKWKSDITLYNNTINENLDNINNKVTSLWYTPGIPGYQESKTNFEHIQ